MAGQRQKAREELAFKRGGRDTVVGLLPQGERIEMKEPPANLDLCAEAREVWRLVVPTLEHVSRRELPLLVRYIVWVNLWWKALRAVENDGVAEYTALGSKLSTQFRALREAEMMCERLEAKFGLDPQARLRLGLSAAKTETALQRLRGDSPRKPPSKMGPAA